MSESLFESRSLGSKLRVLKDRVAYKQMLFPEVTVPIKQVASVSIGGALSVHVSIESTGGKTYKFVCQGKDKEAFREAVYSLINES
jgi:N-acetylneuraminic acid mutarotase